MASVSVIIPNYNHAPYLPRRIASVLAQTRSDFEVVILDDCSLDDSRVVIERFSPDPRVRTVFNERNSGNTYLQWQKGIELTHGEYIWIAESDDFSHSGFLERVAAKLDADPGVGLAFCETVVVDEKDLEMGWYVDRGREIGLYSTEQCRTLAHDFVMEGRDYIRGFLFPWNTIPNASAILFRRSALEDIGGPVTSMRLCGDWLTYCKILARWKVGHVADRLNYFRQHRVNVRSNTRGDTLAREWLQVAASVEQEIGPLTRRTRRQLNAFAANALLNIERRSSDNSIPVGRIPSSLARAAHLSPKLLTPTVMTLLRQGGGQLARQLRSKAWHEPEHRGTSNKTDQGADAKQAKKS